MADSIINSGSSFYIGRKFDNQLSAELKNKGNTIFLKDFDATNLGIVSTADNTILLPDHYFVTGEEIEYIYPEFEKTSNNAIGIGTTNVPGIGLTNKLPNTLYVVKVDDTKIKVSDTLEKSLRRIPDVLDLTSTGLSTTGVTNIHTFIGGKQNSRTLLSIDNIIQSPIISTAVTTTLLNSILEVEDLITFTGITSFFSGDLVKINDEVMKLNYVGLGSTATVLVRRPMLGTTLQKHSAGDLVIKLKGNFNIVNNTVFFPEAPFGARPVSNPDARPDDRDYVGLETYSTFNGRVFLRSGIVDTEIAPYDANYIFDDISQNFIGIVTSAVLTSERNNISGFSTGNGVILINNIFQTPDFLDYGLVENTGITTIYFTGAKNRYAYDINTSSIPRGGIVVSVASTEGFGYQPQISAGGTTIVSAAGTIQSISIGNTGSGYRAAKNYQIESDISSIVSAGSSIIFISNKNGLYEILKLTNTGSNCSLNVSDYITSAIIESIGSTTVKVSLASTISRPIPKNETVLINILNPPVGIVNIGIDTGYSENDQFTHIGIATILDGHITSPIKITNVGLGYTNYKQINTVKISEPISAGSTIIYVNNISGITKDNYISINSILKNVKIVGIDGNAILISQSDASPSIIEEKTPVIIKKYDQLPVIFDDPLPYTNLTLEYSSDSPIIGIGSQARVNVTVGQGSSIINYELISNGYSFGQSEILTVPTGGLTGIPTTGGEFREFQITIDRTHTDDFSGWTFGDLVVFDSFDRLFNDRRVLFPLRLGGKQTTVRARPGSNIELNNTLIVFFNDVLQVPDVSYIFNGGSFIQFTEPPRSGDKCVIVFYQGTSSVDVKQVDILETIKLGDSVQINSQVLNLQQDDRVVTQIKSTDVINTAIYPGPGVSQNVNLKRPITWCKQMEDIFINGEYIGKDRTPYEPSIYPTTRIIKSVGIGSTEVIYVETVKTFFDSDDEYQDIGIIKKPQKIIQIISKDDLRQAAATATVSSIGEISSISVTDGGVGYTTSPSVSIEYPTGIGITGAATASSIITGDKVTSISIIGVGSGYSQSNPPKVFIGPPEAKLETIEEVFYEGDFGIITGVAKTSTAQVPNGLILDLFIPFDSYLRDKTIVGTAITVSKISPGYYFSVDNSNIGSKFSGLNSLNSNGSIVSYGSSHIDNVYEVSSVSIGTTDVVGYGLTYVAKVVVSVEDYNGLTGTGYSNYYGNYTWGRISNLKRFTPKSFEFYKNGPTGIATSPVVIRKNPLKYINYTQPIPQQD